MQQVGSDSCREEGRCHFGLGPPLNWHLLQKIVYGDALPSFFVAGSIMYGWYLVFTWAFPARLAAALLYLQFGEISWERRKEGRKEGGETGCIHTKRGNAKNYSQQANLTHLLCSYDLQAFKAANLSQLWRCPTLIGTVQWHRNSSLTTLRNLNKSWAI